MSTDDKRSRHALDEAALDALVHALPRDLPPAEDLWPAIAKGLEARTAAPTEVRGPGAAEQNAARPTQALGPSSNAPARRWYAPLTLAASVALAGLLGFWLGAGENPAGNTDLADAAAPDPAPIAAPAVAAGDGTVPASLRVEADLQRARASLAATLDRQIAALPDDTRSLVLENLATINGALNDIDAALAEAPDATLDRQLLVTMYADQLALLTAMSRVIGEPKEEILL